MDEIASEAGYNKALLHYYFRSKEKLFHEIVVQIFSNIIPKFAYAMESEGSFWQKTEVLVDTYLSILIEQPDIPFFIMYELSQKRENFIVEIKNRSKYFPAVNHFILQMHQEMEAGKIRKMPPLHLFLNIMG